MKLPNEIWMIIFRYLDPFTLGNCARACRRFRALATEQLVCSIQWKNYDRAWANLDFWDKNTHLLRIPRKLTLAVDLEPRRPSKSFFHVIVTLLKISSDQPLTQIFDRIITFQMLEEISLAVSSLLPAEFFCCIAGLPRLRSLRLENCHLGPVQISGTPQIYSYVSR